MSLIAERKHRNVFRVGVAHAIVAWLLIEVASVASVAAVAVILVRATEASDDVPPLDNAAQSPMSSEPASLSSVDWFDTSASNSNPVPASTGGTPLLDAIQQLEESNDPKCHSTASRFEDFLYGTPLSDEAREQQIKLQKQLIRQLWARASRLAAEAGEREVTRLRIEPFIDAAIPTTTTDDDFLEVHPLRGEPLKISPVRARQFASIAYSLRALLSVQQDSLLESTPKLLQLDEGGTEALRSATDTATLCALKLADQDARQQNDPEVGPELLVAAWRRCIPDLDTLYMMDRSVADRSSPDRAASQSSRDLFFAMTDGKIAAFRAYNELDEAGVKERFANNMKTYYAVFLIPYRMPFRGDFFQAYHRSMRDFTRALLEKAIRSARESGHELIRAADANRAVKQLLPHEVDEFEDLLFFFHLPDAQRVTLESYDCDSYRDTALHWSYLRTTYLEHPTLALVPDPFAAEIITEAISGYGVLLPRMAGLIAREPPSPPSLRPQQLELARDQIADRAKQHHRTTPRLRKGPEIVSSAAEGAATPTSPFFTDVTGETGIEFMHRSSRWLSEFRRTRSKPPTYSGGGVAAEDIDNDGRVDLLFVGGIGNGLFINDGRGRFREVTEEAGIDFWRPDGSHAEARQGIIADFDNDGWQDILIVYNRDDHRLYRGLDGTHFKDVTSRAGLGGADLSAGPATAFDYDNDGLLDIYVTYFGDYVGGAKPLMERSNTNALPNRLFRNLGSMRFRDVTDGSGADDTGWSQGVTHTDFDRDGRQDLIVANDFGRNVLLRNLSNGRFQDVSEQLGLTKAYHSMNVGIADLNRDGYPDIYISNIATMVKDTRYLYPEITTPLNFDEKAMANMLVKEANVLYMSQVGNAGLERYEPSSDVERGETSTGWAWDAEFFDFDLDGDDDLYVVNGTNDYYLYGAPLTGARDGKQVFYHLDHRRESNVFYVNESGKLKNLSSLSGADFRGNSRSTAYLDYDEDGDLDIAVNNFHAPATMLRNNAESRSNNWVKIRLIGDPALGSNRDAIGARIVATDTTGLHVLREVQSSSGYMSTNPKQQHIGLGRTSAVDLEITWPNGEKEVIRNVAANRSYTIQQGGDRAMVADGGVTHRAAR